MTPEQFAYWLQGFVELHGDQPTPEQWQSIKDHLQLVFEKVTLPVQKELSPGDHLRIADSLRNRIGYPMFFGDEPRITC